WIGSHVVSFGVQPRPAIHVVGKTHWVTFKYEKLPIFCFRCGRILHESGGCPERDVVGSEARWGTWLLADPLKPPSKLFVNNGNGGQGVSAALLQWWGVNSRLALMVTFMGPKRLGLLFIALAYILKNKR
ncbi:hypothetical protein SLA2020_440910, partial [Shorea laevis]